MKSVFISYSNDDEKSGVLIVDRLKQEGFTVWFAPDDFQLGDSFSEIFDQIDRCDAFVVLLSSKSAHSPWVNKEMDVAITRQLSARPLLLIPAYLEPIDPLRKVADLKPIDLSQGRWDKALDTLVRRLAGQDLESDPSLQSFEHYLNSLVQIQSSQLMKRALALASPMQPKMQPPSDDAITRIQAEIGTRTLQALSSILDEAGVSGDDQARILDAAQHGIELPLVSRSHVSELRRFARRADETVIRLAGELWQMRHMQGITLDWLEEWLSRYLREHFSFEDEELLGWKAESLVDEARAAGLLVRSTEEPRGYAEVDARYNPSYDLGPMVWIAGRLVAAFTARRQQILS